MRSSRADRLGGDPELGLAARHEIDHRRGVIRVGEGDVDARVGDPERADQRGDGVDGERRQRAEVETSGGRARRPRRPRRGPSRRRAAPGAAGSTSASPAAVSDDPAAHAVEQRRAELGLELADRLRHRGLRHVLGFRGPGHAAVVDHREEQAELPQIHRYSL